MLKRQILNIVNFIRACEPRVKVDLVKPVREQIRLMKRHGLRGTFLIQYDALLEPVYNDMLKELDPAQFEIGVWHEIVQPEVEKLGIKWTGRWAWDWHVHCGFAVGYTKSEREAIADELFAKFREVFGYYPRVFGSWFFDTHTVRYLSSKYGLDALCNCKEQYGTDGYTLWGGYYGQAYYPSIVNMFMPSQSEATKMDVPLFRMLGSDQIYQYDFGMSVEEGAGVQGVITLEPVYTRGTGGGGVPRWVDWYMRENYNGECLTFGYAQAGQENPFGWDAMGAGLTYQFALFEKLRDEGKIIVEPLGDTGRWYKKTYAATPASTITAHTTFDDRDRDSMWYSSRFYRCNLYTEEGVTRIRDLHVFDDGCPDPFEDRVCESNEVTYETLPVADGNRHSGNGVRAGVYFAYADGSPILTDGFAFTDCGGNTAIADYGTLAFTLGENFLRIESGKDFTAEYRSGGGADYRPGLVSLSGDLLKLKYAGREYGIKLTAGRFLSPCRIESEGGVITAEIILV